MLHGQLFLDLFPQSYSTIVLFCIPHSLHADFHSISYSEEEPFLYHYKPVARRISEWSSGKLGEGRLKSHGSKRD